MIRPASLRNLPSLLTWAVVLLFPGFVEAGTFPYWGVSFGTPERAAAQFGVSFGRGIPTEAGDGVALGSGPVIEGALGLGGARLGVGRSFLLLTEEKSVRVFADFKVVGRRTWDRPRGASAHASYLGVEGGLSVAFVRLTVGVARRLEDKTRGARTLVTWGIGTQIRLGR
jgi:hypothetical protein